MGMRNKHKRFCSVSAVCLLNLQANQKVRSGYARPECPEFMNDDDPQKENSLELNCTIVLMLQEKSEA